MLNLIAFKAITCMPQINFKIIPSYELIKRLTYLVEFDVEWDSIIGSCCKSLVTFIEVASSFCRAKDCKHGSRLYDIIAALTPHAGKMNMYTFVVNTALQRSLLKHTV